MLEEGHIMMRVQRKVPACEHPGREIAHQRLGLDVEIAKHLVGAPATKEPDAIGVNVGAQKGHGASGAKGASRDIGW